MKTILSRGLSVTFAALCIVASAMLSWVLLLEPPWLTYRNLPFPSELHTVKPGEVVPLIVERCNSSGSVKTYRVTRSLQRMDGAGEYIVLTSSEVNIAPGCAIGTSRVNVVPIEALPGRYRFIGAGLIHGMLREHVVPWRSAEFIVAP